MSMSRNSCSRICEALVNDGLFRMAWIGMVADDGVSVHPLVQSGMVDGYLDKLDHPLRRVATGPGAHGHRYPLWAKPSSMPTPRPIDTSHCGASRRAVWASARRPRRRFVSQQRNIGALNVYSDIPQAFGADEVMLLEKLATDLGIAIERRAAERALRESEAQFRLLLESSPEAIFGVDTQGMCTFVNPACLRMLGYTREEDLVGKSLHPLIHHTHPDGRPYPKEQCQYPAFHAGWPVHCMRTTRCIGAPMAAASPSNTGRTRCIATAN